MAEETSTTVQVEKEVTGKTVISFTKPTPLWATWTFRVVYWLAFAFMVWVAGTKYVEESSKVEIMLAAAAIDRFVWGIARGIGIDKKQFEET